MKTVLLLVNEKVQ